MRLPVSHNRRARRAPVRFRRTGGMVLLEAMLALAVFAIAVVGLARALNMAVLNSREARQISAVTRSMENALEEALHRPNFEPGEWTSEPDAIGLVVTTAVREAEMNNGDGQLLGGLYEVQITGVLPGRGKDEQVWQLRTLCFPPLYAGTR